MKMFLDVFKVGDYFLYFEDHNDQFIGLISKIHKIRTPRRFIYEYVPIVLIGNNYSNAYYYCIVSGGPKQFYSESGVHKQTRHIKTIPRPAFLRLFGFYTVKRIKPNSHQWKKL